MVKVPSSRLQQCLLEFTMLLMEGSLQMGFFRHSSNHGFWSPELRKCIAYEGHLFFENVQNLNYISGMQRKIEKKSLLSEIIVYELVTLNYLYSEENTCHRQSIC